MGNPDRGSTARMIEYSEVLPQRKLVDTEGVIQLVYPVLNEIDGVPLAEQLLTDEMVQWISEHSAYEVINPDSLLAKLFLRQLNGTVNKRLAPQGYKTEVAIGTPVMQERDDANPMRAINVLFGVVRKKGNPTKMALVMHPIQPNEDGKFVISPQHRSDDGSFWPSMLLVEPQYPFGFRSDFNSFTSYPLQKK